MRPDPGHDAGRPAYDRRQLDRAQPLAGHVALVTGAGSAAGIGFATALELGRAGARVIITSTTARVDERVTELRNAGMDASGFSGDLTDSTVPASLVAGLERLDICVNNAGMIAVGETMLDASVETIDDHQWRTSIDRNLTTCFNVTRAVIPLMRSGGYGRIVNVASTSGPVQAFSGDAAYHAAKAGIVGFTRAVALEVAAAGITVNAVAPGWIATGSQTEGEAAAGRLTPLRRSGTPEEVAAAIRFLSEPAASYITGQLLVIDGGNSLPEDRTWQQ